MKLRPLITSDRLRRGAAGLGTALAGIVLLLSSLGDFWIIRSYDWLFSLRPAVNVSREGVVIVEMDAESERVFNQTPNAAWDRRLHAELLKRLSAEHADAIAFDVVFQETNPGPSASDQALLQATRDHGRVVFGARPDEGLTPSGEKIVRIHRSFERSLPIEQVGLVESSFDADGVIRKHYPGDIRLPSLARRMVELTAAKPPGGPFEERWVNYYGPPGEVLPRVSFWRVLSNAVPGSINFSNKPVFVGARTLTGYTAGSGTDFHLTPFGKLITGVEINATTYLNLRRGDWLRRGPLFAEAACLVLLGWVMGSAAGGASPGRAAGLVVIIASGVVAGALALCWFAELWFPWVIVIGAQLPCAIALPILFRTTPGRLAHDAARSQPSAADGSAVAVGHAPRISDHTMLRCIGRGAYGEVWLARDVIGSFHAVKLVYRSSFQSDEPFEREFRGMQKYTPLSRNHPGWVHILHVGKNEAEGYFFYVMEAGDDEVSGQEIDPPRYRARNLARELEKRRHLPIQESVDIGVALADALDYLHGQLLVHRDIKPSNVIFVHGAPKFADVGLVTEVRNREHTVSMLGTEGYIAPEGPGTAAADLYSLGKLLYEMNTGRDRRAFPEVGSSLVPASGAGAQQRLSAIIAKACRDDPRERYQSASDLRDDLSELQRKLAAP